MSITAQGLTAPSARIVNDPDEGRAARDLLVTNDVRDRSGTDRFAARATEHSTDEVCRGKAKI
jgi:hypothetical protein